jgi:hypothetical protein
LFNYVHRPRTFFFMLDIGRALKDWILRSTECGDINLQATLIESMTS